MANLRVFELQNSLNEKYWKLSSYILSKYDFDKLAHPWGEYWCIFENQFTESFEATFFKELVELSGLIRALLDSESIKIKNQIHGIDNSFGTLKNKDNETISLSFREACNKIIHSSSYNITLSYINGHPLKNGRNGYEEAKYKRFKNPIIETKGSYNGKEWTANIIFLKIY